MSIVNEAIVDGGEYKQRVWLSGDEYTVLVDGEVSGGSMAVLEVLVPHGGGPPPHVHTDADELLVVLEGTVVISVGENRQQVSQGGLVFVNRGVSHGFINRALESARMLLCYSPSGMERFFLTAGVPAISGQLPPPDTPESIARVDAIAARFNTFQSDVPHGNNIEDGSLDGR